MEYSTDYDGLREPEILPDYNPIPQFITEINVTSTIEFPVYEPIEPGVYSVILEVADRANNSRYARRIVIYDNNTSEVSLIPDSRLYASSASSQTDFIWQTTPNSDSSQITTIHVSWVGRFVNKLHKSNHFLSKVLDFTPRLSDNIQRIDYKRIDPDFDDNEGDRNKNPITNINAIVRFETVQGTESTSEPSLGWTVVSPLRESETFVLSGVNIRDGDSHQVWVRGSDVMGNTKTDTTVIHFDSSPPKIWQPTFLENVNDGVYHFSSRVIMPAKDQHSGIKKISFNFFLNKTGVVTKEIDLIVPTETTEQCENNPTKCYCIRKGDCFMMYTALDVNNCWFSVANEIISLKVTVYNLAMLPNSIIFTIGMVDNFNGIGYYYSPSYITILKSTGTSLRINWVQAPTCYERAGIIIKLFMPDNSTKEFKVHKDATTFDINGLSAGTHYWLQLFATYGNENQFVMSESPAVLKFTTSGASQMLPLGGVAGLPNSLYFIPVIALLCYCFLIENAVWSS